MSKLSIKKKLLDLKFQIFEKKLTIFLILKSESKQQKLLMTACEFFNSAKKNFIS